MTKKELIKYLQGKRKERINELKAYYEQEKQQKKLEIIDACHLRELAETISQQCGTLLANYKLCVDDLEKDSSHYYGSYSPRKCLETLVKLDLAECIRDSEGIGENALKALRAKHDAMVREVEDTYDKLENFVHDSVRANDAVKYLAELGFDLKIKDIKTDVNTQILFGKKED